MTKTSIIILAAGKGTRMKSSMPKVMHKIAGQEMLNMVIESASKLDPQEIVVVASDDLGKFEQQIIERNSGIDLSFVTQKERRGTADATMVGHGFLKKEANKVLVLYADSPLLKKDTLARMADCLDKKAVCILGFECFEENQYGKLLVDENGNLDKIVEDKDASEEERQIELCNSGVVAAKGDKFGEFLRKIGNDNAAGEFYLTDIVKIARQSGEECAYIVTDNEEVLGVNSRAELAQVEAIKQYELREEHMKNGVTLIDPDSVYFAADTKIDSDCVIHPNVVFGPQVEVSGNVEIRSFSHIEQAKIDSGCTIGPFARIRPGANIAQNVNIGNFVEIKNSSVGEGSKVSHLSYVGDSQVGKNSNIGAGVVTCNYDGYNKHTTTIGDEVFVGSNCALVAPVSVGDKSLVAAGSVITQDVGGNDLAISRPGQQNIKGGAEKFRDNKKNKS